MMFCYCRLWLLTVACDPLTLQSFQSTFILTNSFSLYLCRHSCMIPELSFIIILVYPIARSIMSISISAIPFIQFLAKLQLCVVLTIIKFWWCFAITHFMGSRCYLFIMLFLTCSLSFVEILPLSYASEFCTLPSCSLVSFLLL